MLRFAITLLLAIVPSATRLLATPSKNELARPNVIFVLVDDLGWTDLACFGSEYYRTPNIDRLAAEGIKFTDAYAACAVCSPTRAAVMTGRYPARVGITDWIRARFQGGKKPADGKNPSGYIASGKRPLLCPRNPLWMEREEVTIAEMLKPLGYASSHIGKWHLGMDDWYPRHQGFDENRGGCDYGQPPSYFDPYKNRRLSGIPHLEPRKVGEYLTDREADEAVDFIERHKDKPFFLHLAHYAVHTPIQAKKDLTAEYEKLPKTKQKNAKYAAMVHSVDDAMGKVLKVLDKHDLSKRTVIFFTSDNGGLMGPTHNAPLRSGKGNPYEGGIRVPLIIRWPGVVQPGSTSAEPVTSVDYLPTIAEIAGTKPPNRAIDGVSLVDHLRSGGAKSLGRDAIYWHFPHYRGRIVPYSIVRAGKYKLIRRYEGRRHELFDLEADLGETEDISGREPEAVKKLDAMIERWLKHVDAKVPKTRE